MLTKRYVNAYVSMQEEAMGLKWPPFELISCLFFFIGGTQVIADARGNAAA